VHFVYARHPSTQVPMMSALTTVLAVLTAQEAVERIVRTCFAYMHSLSKAEDNRVGSQVPEALP